jgi:tetratricopeptide (TPR) repeat protein
MQNTETTESTQPNQPVAAKGGTGRGRRFLFNVLGLLILLAVAILGGYASGIGVRETNQSTIIMQQLGEQYQNALIDIEFGRYENARQRLEWIIKNEPSFPGAREKLTEVLVLSNQPTPTLTPSLTPTPDFSGAQEAFTRAQQLIAAQDWPGAISALDQMRKLDPNYEQSKVDGMYYFALRNYGYNLIVQQGNLEGGIYQLTLAERFGPLDRDTNGLRVGARQYLIGASFWELDWAEALRYFNDVAGYNLWDGTMSVSERIHIASMRYGDELVESEQFCDAVTMYQNAEAIAPLDSVAAENFAAAYAQCFPATPTLDPASLTPATPASTEPPKTETTEAPTEAPTQAPTEAPTEASTQAP